MAKLNVHAGILVCCIVLLNQCAFVHKLHTAEALQSMSLNEVDAMLSENPTHSVYLYVRGKHSVTGSPAEAIYYLHKAIRNAPRNQFYREQLQRLEESLEINQQLSIPHYVSSDVFFLGMVALWLVFWLCFVIYQFTRVGALRVCMTCCICLVCLGFGFYVWARGHEHTDFDVVFEASARITRIPSETAQNWISIPLGTAVYTHEVFNDFIRVSNGKVIDGWTHRSTLLHQDEGPLDKIKEHS